MGDSWEDDDWESENFKVELPTGPKASTSAPSPEATKFAGEDEEEEHEPTWKANVPQPQKVGCSSGRPMQPCCNSKVCWLATPHTVAWQASLIHPQNGQGMRAPAAGAVCSACTYSAVPASALTHVGSASPSAQYVKVGLLWLSSETTGLQLRTRGVLCIALQTKALGSGAAG